MLVVAVVFARRIFLIAGVFGLIVVAPMYFLEARIGRDEPPAITHPEYFYGFVGVTLAWQVAFIMISRDPVRYRMLMIPSIIEKATFSLATMALFSLGRMSHRMLVAGLTDLLFGVLFVVAFARTRAPAPARN
jgi:hypothetical protein